MSAISHTRLSRTPLALALATIMLLPTAVMAQDAGQTKQDAEEAAAKKAADSSKPKNLEQVTVVGSRISRSDVEGPAPVVVITREDIQREGFQTVGDMLQTLSQNTTGSFTGDLATAGFTPNAQVVNLRNLGPGYTLTLVNGRRPALYPQPYNRDNNVVNIRAIPSSIVERVEVLTGGASAIYGSDAVAGVVNIVTRKNYEGHEIRATAGTTELGGGNSLDISFTGGSVGDRWSAVYALQASRADPIFASQRELFADTRNNPYGIAVNPSLSLVALSAQGLSGPRNFNVVFDQAACDAFKYTTVTSPTRGKYCGSFDQVASRSLRNTSNYYSAYGYVTYDLTPDTQLFGSVTYYTSDAKASNGTEFWGSSGDPFMRRSNGATTSVYWDDSLKDLIQLQRVFNPFELGGPEAASTLYDETSYDFTFGANGLLSDSFDWEASINYGKYDYVADRPRLLAKGVHDYFLGPQKGFFSGYPVYTLNRDRWNTPITPDIYKQFATRVLNTAQSTSATANLTVSGELMQLPAGALGMAAVLEAVRQTTDLQSDPRTDGNRPLDDQTVYNLRSSGNTKGARDRYALGLEFRIPIFEKLSSQAAVRYDQYDDISNIGGALTYNLGLEYRPFSNLLLRSTYATSFRAPDLQLIYAEGAGSFSTILDELACRSGTGLGQPTPATPRTLAQCNKTGDLTIYQAEGRIAGNPLLEEEKGKSFGAGFVWDIRDSMSMSVDYYRIKLRDAASQLSSGTLLENEANCRLGVRANGTPFENASDSAFCQNVYGLVTRQSAPGTSLDGRVQRINSAYINTALQDSSGIDMTYRYRFDAGRVGNFGLDLGYSLVLTDRYKENDEDVLTDYRDLQRNGQRSRARGTLSWQRESWSAALFGTRVGSALNNGGTGRLAPYFLYNAQVSKKFGTAFKVDLSVVNLFNNQYRPDPTFTGYPYFNIYNGSDPIGRRYFVTGTYKF